jgi:pyroglutamyl-peptidase
MAAVIIVTGFEPFGDYQANPTEELAKAVDGRQVGSTTIKSLVLPVHHARATARVASALAELAPTAILHLGLAGGRARIALEWVAVNVMDYEIPDNAGYRATGEACVPGGPAAYFATLPLDALLAELTAEGIPAYVSNTAGTYLCNQTMYTTLHAVRDRPRPPRAGLIHVPLLPAMVAASGQDAPSMDFAVMLRGLALALAVLAAGDTDP